MSETVNFDKEELRLLNTKKGLKYLLQSEQPDFEDTVKQLKYDKELQHLQAKLISVQNSILKKNEHVLILVEGREFAGKGRPCINRCQVAQQASVMR